MTFGPKPPATKFCKCEARLKETLYYLWNFISSSKYPKWYIFGHHADSDTLFFNMELTLFNICFWYTVPQLKFSRGTPVEKRCTRWSKFKWADWPGRYFSRESSWKSTGQFRACTDRYFAWLCPPSCFWKLTNDWHNLFSSPF